MGSEVGGMLCLLKPWTFLKTEVATGPFNHLEVTVFLNLYHAGGGQLASVKGRAVKVLKLLIPVHFWD